jgi:hypothetical protein
MTEFFRGWCKSEASGDEDSAIEHATNVLNGKEEEMKVEEFRKGNSWTDTEGKNRKGKDSGKEQK